MKFLLALVIAAAALAMVVVRPGTPRNPAPLPFAFVSAPPSRAHSGPPARSVVYVAGEVVHPGVYAVPSGARVADALARAGGARPDGDLIAVNLAALARDGEEVIVPVRGAAPAAGAAAVPRHRVRSGASGSRRRRASRPIRAAPAAGQDPVDVNTGDAAAIGALPGIGPELAARIVAFRELNGPFRSPDELLDVAGITERRFAAIAPFVVAR